MNQLPDNEELALARVSVGPSGSGGETSILNTRINSPFRRKTLTSGNGPVPVPFSVPDASQKPACGGPCRALSNLHQFHITRTNL